MEHLTPSQSEFCDIFLKFLLDKDKKYICLSGQPGTGKSYLCKYLINDFIPKAEAIVKDLTGYSKHFNVLLTATTNKAAYQLRQSTGLDVTTIYSAMNLIVVDDYATGESSCKPSKNYKVQRNKLVFIDECSMINKDLWHFITTGFQGSKIIFIGDKNQLAPVKEKISPVFNGQIPIYELKEPVRNRSNTALQDLCNQLKETVETGIFKPIQIIPGSIDLLDEEQMESKIKEVFTPVRNGSHIGTYTNKRVNLYSSFIKNIRGYTKNISIGECIVANNTIEYAGKILLNTEDCIYVHDLSEPFNERLDDDTTLEYQIINNLYMTPTDPQYYQDLIKYYARLKKWNIYFKLKNNFGLFRSNDVSTLHKAQGSTYDSIFIDLTDLSTCTIPAMAARLLYVGVSRARSHVYFYGNLKEKYGGISI